MTHLCVGGPWDGKRVELKQGAESLVLPNTEPMSFIYAYHDDPKAPYASVTVHHHVYKLKSLGFASGGEFDARVKVLAYFGRDRQDRPEGFYL